MSAWDWNAEGFAQPPRTVQAVTGQRVYRVWGGSAEKLGNPTRPGVCLSSQKPETRRDAEQLFAVWEWGNSSLWVTTFEVVVGTAMFVGQVDPGRSLSPALAASGEQILIEQPVFAKLREITTERLRDDLGGAWIVPHAGQV